MNRNKFIKPLSSVVTLALLFTAVSCGNLLSAGAAGNSLSLADVSPGSWYAEAVQYCADNSIISPRPDALFLPEAPMTRADAAFAFWQTAAKDPRSISQTISSAPPLKASTFRDVPEDALFRDAVSWAASQSIISGYNDANFGPQDTVTREQMAAILYRYEHNGKNSGSNAPTAEESLFSDHKDISSWAESAVSWTVRQNIITGRPGNRFAPQAPVTRAEAAVMIYRYLTAYATQSGKSAEGATEDDGTSASDGTSGTSFTPNQEEKAGETMIAVNLTIGTETFLSNFYDNESSQALLAQMPLTLDMTDLHQNEKYHYLSERLPASSTERPATMQAGDIMLWNGDCLVLFYETFSNAYGGYVRLGRVEDVDRWVSALGPGNITVTFSSSNQEDLL